MASKNWGELAEKAGTFGISINKHVEEDIATDSADKFIEEINNFCKKHNLNLSQAFIEKCYESSSITISAKAVKTADDLEKDIESKLWYNKILETQERDTLKKLKLKYEA